MDAHKLDTIQSDLRVAKTVLYEKGKPTTDPFMLNQVAYHSAQAIEKSLKFLIYKNGTLPPHLAGTHNTESLVLAVENVKPNFISEHPYISRNAVFLKNANTLRYMDEKISFDDTMKLYKSARALYNEIDKEYPIEKRHEKAENEHKYKPDLFKH